LGKYYRILKKIILFALLSLVVVFSSYSGLMSSLMANAAIPVSNQLQQQQHLQLPAIASLLRSPNLAPNVSPSVPQSLQRATTLISAIGGNNLPVQNGGTTTSNSISFTFAIEGGIGVARGSATAPGVAGFECSLDNTSPASCNSPTSIHNIAAGNHIFQVRAIDMTGNMEPTGASFSWTVVVGVRSSGSNGPQLFTAAPPNAATTLVPQSQQAAIRTTIISAIGGNNLPVQNGGTTTSNSISFTFAFGIPTGTTTTATSGGVVGFQCTLDNTILGSCTSQATIHNLAAGSHIFQVRGIGTTGDKEPKGASFSWTVLAPSSSPTTQPAGKAKPVPTIPPSSTTVPSSSTGGTNASTAPITNNNKTTATTTTTKSNLTPKTGSKVLGGWTGYAGIGDCVIGNPTTASVGSGAPPGGGPNTEEQVFVVGCDHALHYNTQDNSGAWSKDTSLGGYAISNPVAASPGLPEVFVVGSNHAIYYVREQQFLVGGPIVWSGFTRLGGYILGDPVVDTVSPGVVILVVVGSDHALYINIEENPGHWSGFSRLGGKIYAISNPALALDPDGGLQIFVVGSDHALYTSAETTSGTYSDFARLGGYVIGNPAVEINDNRLLDAFVIGSDHIVYVNRETASTGTGTVGTWNGFEKLGGGPLVISDPVVTANAGVQLNDGSHQINLFVIGSDHAAYHLAQDGANSDSWVYEGLGGYVIGNPGTGLFLNTSGTSVFELFVVGSNKALYVNGNPAFF